VSKEVIVQVGSVKSENCGAEGSKVALNIEVSYIMISKM